MIVFECLRLSIIDVPIDPLPAICNRQHKEYIRLITIESGSKTEEVCKPHGSVLYLIRVIRVRRCCTRDTVETTQMNGDVSFTEREHEVTPT